MTVTAVPLQPVKRSYLAWLWVGIVVALVAAFLLARQGDSFMARNAREPGVKVTASGLQYKELTPGTGPHPTDKDVALINYEGTLTNGTVFDASKQPTPMPVSGVVPGFSEALKLMSKGGKYRVWIPAKIGYGDKANGPIPANSTLAFDIELLEFIPEAQYRQIMMQQQMGGMGGAPGGPGGGAGGEPAGAGAPGTDEGVAPPTGK
jgi:FKBP-type peptidyl-prolyl cis-trans isomerase FkpA